MSELLARAMYSMDARVKREGFCGPHDPNIECPCRKKQHQGVCKCNDDHEFGGCIYTEAYYRWHRAKFEKQGIVKPLE